MKLKGRARREIFFTIMKEDNHVNINPSRKYYPFYEIGNENEETYVKRFDESGSSVLLSEIDDPLTLFPKIIDVIEGDAL